MDSVYIRNFSIEVTRRCNMACSHCMRGNAMTLDISHAYIRNMLSRVRAVHNINITGGEPSLNVKAMRYLLSHLKHREIHVDRFYIVTNGSLSSISHEFIETCCALYDYQTEKVEDTGRCMLELSDDRFHDSTGREKVVSRLSELPFSVCVASPNTCFFSRKEDVPSVSTIRSILFTWTSTGLFMVMFISMPKAWSAAMEA